MRNIMLHDPASSIIIRIEEGTHDITLSITYEGADRTGLFPPDSKMWTGIRERASSINCELKIDDSNALQTQLSVTVAS